MRKKRVREGRGEGVFPQRKKNEKLLTLPVLSASAEIPAAAGAPMAGLSAASRPSCAAVIPCELRKTL